MTVWKTWADYPPVAAALSALAIGTGLAQIHKVTSQSPSVSGKGFDDPKNDAIAEMGGRKWARDLVSKVADGFNKGMSDAFHNPAASPVARANPPTPERTSQPRGASSGGSDGGLVVNFNAPVYDSEAAMRRLHRELARIARLETARKVGGG
jgi:hypothetical protein